MSKPAAVQITFDNREAYKVGFQSKNDALEVVQTIKDQCNEEKRKWISIPPHIDFKRDNFLKTVRSIEVFEGDSNEGED